MKVHMTETQTWFYSVPRRHLRVAGAAFLLKRSQWCLQLPVFSWNLGCGLQQLGVGPREVAALEVPAGGMSVAGKSLENVRNQKAKSMNLLSPGTVLCYKG